MASSSRNGRNDSTASHHSDMPITPITPITPVTPANGPPQSEPEEELPELKHLISAIFVPLQENLLEPIEPPKDHVERLERMAASLDASEKAVRDNLAWMLEREARRRIAVARKTLPTSVPDEPQAMRWEEADGLVANVTATAKPNQVYHLPPQTLEEYSRSRVNVPDNLPPHEKTTRDLLMVAHNGSVDLEAYSSKHVKNIRDRLNADLEKAKSGS